MDVGERIKQLRAASNMTQKELADLCGIADSAVRKYESGKVNPKLEMCKKLANAFGLTLAELFGWEDTNIGITAGEAVKPILNALGDEGGENSNTLEEPKAKEYLDKMLDAYRELNLEGKKTAAERVEELTHIEKYKAADKKE